MGFGLEMYLFVFCFLSITVNIITLAFFTKTLSHINETTRLIHENLNVIKNYSTYKQTGMTHGILNCR